MRAAIESEAHRIQAPLGDGESSYQTVIQFSSSIGTDSQQGRLWTEMADATAYESLCRTVKKESIYDKQSGLWVKRVSLKAFAAYETEKQKALAELVQKNRRIAIEILHGRIMNDNDP